MVVLKLLFPVFVWDLFLFAYRGCCLLGIDVIAVAMVVCVLSCLECCCVGLLW